MSVRIQFRRGTATEWSNVNPVLAEGELGYESTSKKIKFGDGQTAWLSLPVAAAGDITSVVVNPGSGLRYGASTDGYGTGTAGTTGNVELELDPTVVISPTSFNAKGDLIVGTADNSFAVVPVGTSNGQALVVNSASSSGVSWGTVTNPTISNGYITTDMLAASSVTNAKLATDSVTADKIANLAVNTAEIADNAVTTAKITDLNVTTAKLADLAVSSGKLADSAVTNAKLAANAVTSAKVDGTIYQRSTTGFTATSARIFITSTTPTGSPGDIWFKY